MKKPGLIIIFLSFVFLSKAQQPICFFKPPQFTIHFGTGTVQDPNNRDLMNYSRVGHYCPSDGYYSFASYTNSCFQDDWHTLYEDHTPGDEDGNMLLVNAGRKGTVFLSIPVNGLKGNTIYELGLWLMNLCKPTKKCPFPLLPDLYIRLETPDGKIVANIVTGSLPRVDEPRWTQHRATFTTPASASSLMLIMTDNIPSGCGNDFALDDITFRECVKQEPQVTKTPTTVTNKQSTVSKTQPKKIITPTQKKTKETQLVKPKIDSASKTTSVINQNQKIIPAAPLVLKTRENTLARKIETDAGEIKVDLYDNGDIDGDTVSIYHNNTLIRSKQRLSQKPISITLSIDPSQPHHELIMVAENLGSIPPNTSVMIITTANNRYKVSISSSEQKNAKVVFTLRK